MTRPRLTTLKSTLNVLKSPLQTIDPSSWRAGKTTAAQRGYGAKWQRARALHLQEHPLCVRCMEVDRLPVVATVVDHKIAHRGDMALFWDRKNWQSLCASHHSSEKQRLEAQEYAQGTRRSP